MSSNSSNENQREPSLNSPEPYVIPDHSTKEDHQNLIVMPNDATDAKEFNLNTSDKVSSFLFSSIIY